MNLATLRPEANTAAAIDKALERARVALVENDGRTAEALAKRDGLLLEDSPKELTAAERALIEARGDSERVQAIVGQLEARLAAARQHEAVDRVATAAQDFKEADAARAAWWRECGPRIREMLEEGHRYNEAAWAAMQRHKASWQQLERDYQDYPAEKLATLHLQGDQQSNARELDVVMEFWGRGDFSLHGVE